MNVKEFFRQRNLWTQSLRPLPGCWRCELQNPQKFTLKQLRFIQFYNGNGTEAARLAGYKGKASTLAMVDSRMALKFFLLKLSPDPISFLISAG